MLLHMHQLAFTYPPSVVHPSARVIYHARRVVLQAFEFKKRYMAEMLMEGPSRQGGRGAVAGRAAGSSATFRAESEVDYEAEWRSGSELSDAYEDESDALE